MTCGIYLGKKYGEKKAYLGLSTGVEGRIISHKSMLRHNHPDENIHFRNAWALYGENAFVWGILEECPDELLSEREIFWEQKLKEEGWMLYNTAPCGGRPPIRYGDENPSKKPEVREKISKAQKGEKNHIFGKTISVEVKKKMSDAKIGEKNSMYGKITSEEVRNKISNSRKGKNTGDNNASKRPEVRKKMSEKLSALGEFHSSKRPEVREKLSETKKGDKNPSAILSWVQVREIRRLRIENTKLYTYRKLGEMFGLTTSGIQGIIENRSWIEP